MRFNVTVEVMEDDGTPFWGYSHIEAFVPQMHAGETEPDHAENTARLAEKVLHRVDEAGATIMEQAGIDTSSFEAWRAAQRGD